MTWWQKLKNNPLARFGAVLLIAFYLIVIAAEFVAPYAPSASQVDGALLPPTQIYWRNQAGEWIGPHVYPTTQGPVSLETGDRQLIVDRNKPLPLGFLVKGDSYQWLGIRSDRHLFGTVTPNEGKFNLLGTDEQARDQFSRLVHGGRVSLSIGLIGVIISFPLGMLVGGISGYFGGLTDSVLMRLVEVLMTIPGIYLLVALAAVLPAGITSTQRFLLIIV
ncbi:MAG: ABC transporter permease, partial [Leptolyngbyaceae bacterium]|nr:ABC transporter permease [Leptolyngbyaceae bacterium]